MNPLNQRMICAKFGWNGPVVLEKKIVKCYQWIFTILQFSTLEKGCAPSFEYPYPTTICAQFGWNWSIGIIGKENENVKSLQKEGWTDGWRITSDQNSSAELRYKYCLLNKELSQDFFYMLRQIINHQLWCIAYPCCNIKFRYM